MRGQVRTGNTIFEPASAVAESILPFPALSGWACPARADADANAQRQQVAAPYPLSRNLNGGWIR